MAALVKRTEINRRRQRHMKLYKLREKFVIAKSDDEKQALMAKVNKVAPWLSEAEFLAPLEAKEPK